MILDYKNNLDFALENGISISKMGNNNEYIYFNKNSEEDEFEGITFKNFPNLYLENDTFTDCCFVNCDQVEISDGSVIGSTFENTLGICGVRCDFTNCLFKNIETDSQALLIDSYGEVNGCTFENIKAIGDDGRICKMVVDREKDVQDIVNCRFVNCSMEAADKSLSLCSYHTVFGKEKMVENIDYDTCEIVK